MASGFVERWPFSLGSDEVLRATVRGIVRRFFLQAIPSSTFYRGILRLAEMVPRPGCRYWSVHRVKSSLLQFLQSDPFLELQVGAEQASPRSVNEYVIDEA